MGNEKSSVKTDNDTKLSRASNKNKIKKAKATKKSTSDVPKSIQLSTSSLSTTRSAGGAIADYAISKGYWSMDDAQKDGVSIDTVERANDLNLLDSDLDQTTFIVTTKTTPEGDTPLFTITENGKVAIYMINKQTNFSSISAKEVVTLDSIVKYLNDQNDGAKVVNMIRKSDVKIGIQN
ncbi:hypothetical protein [Paucilactobacillus hokkaidonensis]|uniref:hypothetical protein n=1 Tax=Paucilactobacillus hokkaidonensis TaxID=1193095 RepID=UPI000596BC70|nr:hypothetical protein [Paucilactobacillus hokkaidonensis]